MKIYNIHEAKTHLSKLVEQAAKGEPFVIAKAGRPMVQVSPLSPRECDQRKRTGFLAGEISVPADFDTMGANDIEQMFGAGS